MFGENNRATTSQAFLNWILLTLIELAGILLFLFHVIDLIGREWNNLRRNTLLESNYDFVASVQPLAAILLLHINSLAN